ncbi:unnamed protein product [Arctogadus glacialis]
MAVVRTIYDRTSMITGEKDRREEENPIRKALTHWQYPGCAINKGEANSREKRKQRGNKKKSQERNVHRGMVTLPYSRDVTEKVQRAMKKHLISTPVKPHIKLRQVYNRRRNQKAEQGNLKSAISDHCKRDHIMDWEGAKVIGTENKRFQRWIREAVEIRKRAQWAVNRDDGAYMLFHTWDAVFHKTDGQQRTGRPASSGGTVGPL